MRLAILALSIGVFAAPAMAGDLTSEKLYGRDPGKAPAYACFSRRFDDAWLKARPAQNVAGITVFVAQRATEDGIWHTGNMEVHFRDSKATYQVTADCGNDGDQLGCGVDCDGGGYQMTAISTSEISVQVAGYLRYYDIADQPTGATTAGFGEGDRRLTLQRVSLGNCLPLVADDSIKAAIARGELTQ
jgi:hypothetical protein